MTNGIQQKTLGWFSIFRLGLVQACLGAVVVLMTSTLNRLMVVELSMAATLPGFLVGLHYACLLYTSPSPRDRTRSRMPSSA